MSDSILPVPWDRTVFGMSCFEITMPSDKNLAHAATTPGHYTVKVDPLSDKSLLHRYEFYYTDTLLEPWCCPQQFVPHPHPEVSLNMDVAIDDLLPMCERSFVYGRFHRDFNLSSQQSDQRYKQWLTQMHHSEGVMGLLFQNELAGFIAHEEGALRLHAVDKRYRDRGLAKYLWTAACMYLFEHGINEIHSSISAANLAVVNLYASLGFRFRHAVDVYHRLSKIE